MQSLSGRYARRLTTQPRYNGRVGVSQRCIHNVNVPRSTPLAPPNLPELDQKWRLKWKQEASKRRDEKILRPDVDELGKLPPAKKKKQMYILPMFPYPSGNLHLGHFRVYTISDVLSRFRRMQGHDVMHPIGWDAFGLPAENAARDRGLHPQSWTRHNIKEMWKQLERMNGQWDLERELSTCEPNFYKHTQRLFLLLHERGLAYQAEAMVNYDPVDKTVLANEQVDAKGFSWRSGAKVEKKMLRQWFFKISEFRQQLLDDLDHLSKDGAWPERVLTMQRNWLGKSTGAQIKFKVTANDGQTVPDVQVFTTRPDTLFGVQYLALASTHPLVQRIAKTDTELQRILNEFPSLAEDSKLGYLLPNVHAKNPLVSDSQTPQATKSSIPIYVAPYVLGNYGDGAVMGVPGHDARDYAFWKENNPQKPVRMVIQPSNGSTKTSVAAPFVGKGVLTSQSGPFAGLSSDEASKKILDYLRSESLGSNAETWRLRDWLVSRQRYWGAPIPIIHCDSCGPVPVPVDQLPVKLPTGAIDWTQNNGNDLLNNPSWLHTTCPECHGKAKRETDTMDTFVDSSWYFMRFPDFANTDAPFSAESANAHLPVDLYIGGVEHAILHLLYARFVSKFLATTPLWSAGSAPEILGEPFKQVLTQGMVHGKTYSDPLTGRFLKPDEVNLTNPLNPIVVSTGATANITFEKMSKSKYNGVDPGTCMDKYGADATRAHMLFQAPVSDVLEWDENKINGVIRWFNKLFDFVQQRSTSRPLLDSSKELPVTYFSRINRDPEAGLRITDGGDMTEQVQEARKLNLERDKRFWRGVQDTIMSVTESYGRTHSLNTVVSDLMILTNNIIEYAPISAHNDSLNKPDSASLKSNSTRPCGNESLTWHGLQTLIKLMAPITPAVSEELWNLLHADLRPPGERNQKCSPGDLPGTHLDATPPLPSNVGSIFDETFPTLDNTYDLLVPRKRACAVQINGKLRILVEIPPAPESLRGEELEKWVTAEILKTKEGKAKLMGDGEGKAARVDIRSARKVVVIKSGKTVNFVV